LEQRTGKDYIDWVDDYWTSRGKPLDFKYHKYLNQIYNDQTGRDGGEIVYQKSTQVGITERMISEALWLPDQQPFNSVYFFPTSSTVGDLVQERVDEPINNSKYLSDVSGRAKKLLGKQADKIGLKRMSKGFIYFRGSNALPAITSVSADAIFVDELDRMDPKSIPYFEKRLEHSSLRWKRWASTPTIHGFGINAKFIESDQNIYQVKCNHCNEWQALDFWKNVDINRVCIVCKKCKQKIEPFKLSGEWVPKFPDKRIRGYHINQLYSPRFNLEESIKASQRFSEFEIQQFYNQNHLGLPYESKGAKLNELNFGTFPPKMLKLAKG
jgi:phage terminase large subunit GpA-like protein